MSVMQITGGGVTLKFSAPSLPPEMDDLKSCKDFRAWMTGKDELGNSVSMRARWTNADGKMVYADVANADWLIMVGAMSTAHFEVLGDAEFSVDSE